MSYKRYLPVLAAVGVAALGIAAQPFGPAEAGGMMGGGTMMGDAASNRPVYSGWGGGVLDYGQLKAYLQQGDRSGVADAKANTVTFSGNEVTIDVVAVQPDHKDQTFEVHGLTNPTLVVTRGAVVHLDLVNMDYGNNMEHGIILTMAPPPYPYMMAAGPVLAQVMPLLPWRSVEALQQAHYATLEGNFVAKEPGTYWYYCPTPQHAQQGMYGKFVVL